MTTSKTFFYLFMLHTAATTTTLYAQTLCPKTQCPGSDIHIRFPFGLKDGQDKLCRYNPSFDLSCNNQNQTTLTLPSGEFIVTSLDYYHEELTINDQQGCLARRLSPTINLSVGSMFKIPYLYEPQDKYTFLNCTSDVTNITTIRGLIKPVTCLSGQNYTVVATYYSDVVTKADAQCYPVPESLVPVMGVRDLILHGGVTLSWDHLDLVCQYCETIGRACGFYGTNNDVGCIFDQPNQSESNKGKGRWAIVAMVVSMILLVVW